ncbi:putative calcium-binding protein CML48 [Drosera capensis]
MKSLAPRKSKFDYSTVVRQVFWHLHPLQAPPPPNDHNTTSSSSNHYPPSIPSRPQQDYHDPYGSYPPQPQHQDYQYLGQQNHFPPGMDPEVVRMFQMVDRDRSRFIDEHELQRALSSSGYQQFSLRTVRLLMFQFKDRQHSSLRIGPGEFAALWDCLGEERTIFERFDRDRSGTIDANELRDALHSLGYAVPPSVLQFLISHYDDRSGRKIELGFDSFIECGMIIKGLTEKFKENDTRVKMHNHLGVKLVWSSWGRVLAIGDFRRYASQDLDAVPDVRRRAGPRTMLAVCGKDELDIEDSQTRCTRNHGNEVLNIHDRGLVDEPAMYARTSNLQVV